jgi:hypothetical protein
VEYKRNTLRKDKDQLMGENPLPHAPTKKKKKRNIERDRTGEKEVIE